MAISCEAKTTLYWSRFLFVGILGLFAPIGMSLHAQESPPSTIHEAVRDIGRALTEGALDAIGAKPPAPRNIHIDTSTRPTDSAVWLPGYWRWDSVDRKFKWVDGVWREPPPGMKWYPGDWQATDRGWVWVRGYWAPVERPTLIVTPDPPPPPRDVTRPPKPGDGFLWIAGHWSFNNGKFDWTAGEWRKVPDPGFIWVDGGWTRTPKGYKYLPGYWDRKADKRIHDGLPPGHGGIPPGHGGTPPGQAKKADKGVPPGQAKKAGPAKGPKGVPPGHRKDKPGK